ncbi:unnamed protein product, partial [Ectocarpus sp. 4 AP-2014]
LANFRAAFGGSRQLAPQVSKLGLSDAPHRHILTRTASEGGNKGKGGPSTRQDLGIAVRGEVAVRPGAWRWLSPD